MYCKLDLIALNFVIGVSYGPCRHSLYSFMWYEVVALWINEWMNIIVYACYINMHETDETFRSITRKNTMWKSSCKATILWLCTVVSNIWTPLLYFFKFLHLSHSFSLNIETAWQQISKEESQKSSKTEQCLSQRCDWANLTQFLNLSGKAVISWIWNYVALSVLTVVYMKRKLQF